MKTSQKERKRKKERERTRQIRQKREKQETKERKEKGTESKINKEEINLKEQGLGKINAYVGERKRKRKVI